MQTGPFRLAREREGYSLRKLLGMCDPEVMRMPSTVNREKAPIIGANFAERTPTMGKIWVIFKENNHFVPQIEANFPKLSMIGAGMLKKAPIIGANFFTNPPINQKNTRSMGVSPPPPTPGAAATLPLPFTYCHYAPLYPCAAL